MRYYLATMMNGVEHSQEVTAVELPRVCLNLSGGGHNPKQTMAALVLMNSLKDGPSVCRRFDNRGREWVLTSIMEASDHAARKRRGSWRAPENVAPSKADARATGLRFYSCDPCTVHPECAVKDITTSRCPVCVYQERKARKQGQTS
jgi:hypothetical protein